MFRTRKKLKPYTLIKPILDYLIGIFLFLLLVPFYLMLMVLLWVIQGRPIFFKQKRMGLNHKVFELYKFRTMKNLYDPDGQLLPDIDRTTSIGLFMRRLSIDELPGFLNVLKGDMSIIGPRPLPPHYKDRYSDAQDRRHLVKPGITGWAQINGRNSISWSDKFKLDIWYVENISFLLDCKIFFNTISYVLKRKDIVPLGKDAMEEFMGD